MRFAPRAVLAFLIAIVPTMSGAATADTPAGGPLQSLSLKTVVVEGAQPLHDVSYVVQRIDAGAPSAFEAKGVNGVAVVNVPSGRYRVTATYGNASRAAEVAVGDQPAHQVVNLRAGTVRMKAISNVGAKAIPSNLEWSILTYGKDAAGNRHLIASSDQAQPDFTLPEGYYLAIVKRGARVTKHTIEVDSGITYKYTVLLR